MFHLQVDVISPLLLNASLLLVLMTDYSDWLVQVIFNNQNCRNIPETKKKYEIHKAVITYV